MIVVAGRVTVKAETREEAKQVALRMAEATRAETGCISYTFYSDLADPNAFFIFEEWESDDALRRHFETPHMAAFNQEIPKHVGGEVKIQRYEVQSVSRLL